jgi:hypothetical protein
VSQQVIWSASTDTTVRKHRSTGATAGQGQSKHFYVGRSGNYDYDGFVKFALNWTGVGRIVSATLVIYTDDGTGDFDLTTKEHPKVVVRRLTDAFSEGNAPDGDWQSNDYTVAAGTTSDQQSVYVSRAANALNRIDITAIVEDWAPTSVKRRNGTAGGAAKNYGLGLFGTSSTDENWAAWSRHATTPSVRPSVELVYEYGPTTPETPTNLSPVGTVASVGSFQGDFSDVRSTDYLAYSEVQVYDAGHAGTSATSDLITSTAHGLVAGDQVYFTSLTGGDALVTFTRYFVIASGLTTNAFKVSTTAGGAAVNITDAHESLTWSKLVYSKKLAATNTEAITEHFTHIPEDLSLARNVTWRWRVRVWDQEAVASPWTALTSFTVTNTNPTPPVALPSEASSFTTLDGVLFGTVSPFSDPDAGNTLFAYQVQLSAFPSGSPNWDEPESILWDTGKTMVPADATTYSLKYGGASLTAGTYYHRQRVWDNFDGVSAWTYRSIVVTQDFDQVAGASTRQQVRPRAPWRIVIREMAFNPVGGNVTGTASTDVITTASAHGLAVGSPVRFSALTGGEGLLVGDTYYVATVPSTTTFTLTGVDFTTNITAGTMTRVTTRGPGKTVAVLEHASAVGASKVFNSPGEAHWTLQVDDPQLAVIEPRQTHYSIQFYTGDGWREVYAGLVWDADASERDVVFYGVDYLGLFDSVLDERYDASLPDKPAEKGGSKYVTPGKNSINYIVNDQLARAIAAPNSPVGFITKGAIASMTETVTVYSTYQPTLSFVTGLLDSHRQGTGKQTRIQVRLSTGGGYEVVVTDVDPPNARENFRLRYGELVQGYRVILFGDDWATRISGIGRTRDGIRVLYKTRTAPGISETVWGRFARATIVDGVSDENDLLRRVQQLATRAGKLGKQLGLGLRSDTLMPFDGYDITDAFPVHIQHGAIDTTALGSGYWTCMAVTWEAGELGQQNTVLTLWPREDTVAPDTDLLVQRDIHTQSEWQIGWKAPDPLSATSKYWLDQETGIVYVRGANGNVWQVSGI